MPPAPTTSRGRWNEENEIMELKDHREEGRSEPQGREKSRREERKVCVEWPQGRGKIRTTGKKGSVEWKRSLLSSCCLLFFGSWVDFWSFGSVFVRFLVVLEWSEGCFGRSFGGLESSWAAPGRSWVGPGRSRALLGRSWRILGRSWPLLSRSWLILSRSWLVLGRSWGGLGPLFRRSWALLG